MRPGIWLALLVLPSMSVGADLVIHRCVQDDGTVAFQEIPCEEPVVESSDDTQDSTKEPAPVNEFFDFENPFDNPDNGAEESAQQSAQQSEQDPPLPASEDRAQCEKTARNAIDAIDAEMRKGYTKEEGQHYLAELLELTRALRACKQR